MTPQIDDHLPLFAFGTLRRGHVNHHYLAGRYERVIAARLPDYAVVAPLMIDRSHGGSVPGELFFLRPGVYEAAMADCDELEGVTPRLSRYATYQRRRVTVLTDQGSFEAWAYVRPTTHYRFVTA
ncbi:MAG: gamma-glutamylcyclotransferase [Planctomycetota bacterium]|nr:gamma-glutamylcyclotransferase [Planctomycetaceae bacterium]MDQ3330862.1 gamma-glutamylcyclotransferase [Planctomycetota bacterium]